MGPLSSKIEDIFKSEFVHLAVDRVPLKDTVREKIQSQISGTFTDEYTDRMFVSFRQHFHEKDLKTLILSVAGDNEEFDTKFRVTIYMKLFIKNLPYVNGFVKNLYLDPEIHFRGVA